MAKWNMIPRIFLLFSVLLPTVGAFADDADISWIADNRGCKVANPFPQPGETITWSGACKNNLADGDGVLQWFVDGKQADRYEGTLSQGWAEGKGQLTKSDGGKYVGGWKHSMQDGDGRFDAPDGSWYEGQWKDGQPHGKGQYQTPDGKTFIGNWVNGEFEGDIDDDPNKT